VVEGLDILRNPHGMLTVLCNALAIPFSEKMLKWPVGRRASDGVWAPAWYDAVEKSTGFARPEERKLPELRDALKSIADAARPHYERLRAFRLAPV
jgi:hypothetical protein